jgi:hypothetical protein
LPILKLTLILPRVFSIYNSESRLTVYLLKNIFKISPSKLGMSVLVLLSFMLSACGGGAGTVEDKTGVLAPISLEISPSGTSMVAKGQDTNFKATATYSNGTTADISTQVSWASKNTDKATINIINGLVIGKGVAVGDATITASYPGGPEKSIKLTVTDAVPTSINIESTALTVAKGNHVTFTAKAAYSDNTIGTVTGSVVWKSSNINVAKLDAIGYTDALAEGTASVTATITVGTNVITSNALSLKVTAAELKSISIASTSTLISKGMTAKFSVVGLYTDGSTPTLNSGVLWSSSNSLVASINGVTGEAKGEAPGDVTVTAEVSGLPKISAPLKVTSAYLTAINISTTAAVSPTMATSPLGKPVTFTVVGLYSDGSFGSVTGSVTWASSSISVASINIYGEAAALSQGTTNITATANGVTSNSISLAIGAAELKSIAINPNSATVSKGSSTTSFYVVGTYTDGSTPTLNNGVTWSSSNIAVATINSVTGSVKGEATGTTTIIAAVNGVPQATANIMVTAAVITSLNINTPTPTQEKGKLATFTATAAYSDGSMGTVTSAVSWLSSNGSVATISPIGDASALAQGFTTITASTIVGTKVITSNSVSLTVKELISLAISPASENITILGTRKIPVSGLFSDGSAYIGTPNWLATCATGAATISSIGVVTGTSVGSCSITASFSGVTSNIATLNVTNGYLRGGAIQGTPLNLQGIRSDFASQVSEAGSSGYGGPLALTTDGSNLYFAGNSIAKINIATRNVTLLAGGLGSGYLDGTGAGARFGSITEMTTDGTYLYVADQKNNVIRRVVIATGVVTTFASIPSPWGITLLNGNLYVTSPSMISKIDIASRAISTLAGGFSAFSGPNLLTGITTDGINLYVADYTARLIRKVVIATGQASIFAGSGNNVAADGIGTAASFNPVTGITTDGSNLYVTSEGSYNSYKLRKIAISNQVVTTLATTAGGNDNQITTDGSHLYFAERYLLSKIE